MEERVILVDARNRQIGTMEKLEAHKKGLLHRAFSIFIFNSNGEMLIHQRAKTKYHCGGLWTNACCSHPRPDEKIAEGLRRKLKQEMGFNTELQKAFDFTYRSELKNGLVEYEFDEVFIGIYNGDIHPNPEEVEAWKFLEMRDIKRDLELNPNRYTPWFRLLFDPISKYYSRLRRA